MSTHHWAEKYKVLIWGGGGGVFTLDVICFTLGIRCLHGRPESYFVFLFVVSGRLQSVADETAAV